MVELLLAAGGFILLVFLILGLVPYLLLSIGMMKMASNEGIENGWYSFVPVLNFYIWGQLIEKKLGKIELLDKIEGNGGKKLLMIYLAGIVLSIIPVIGQIIPFLLFAFNIVIFHWLFEKYTKEPVLFTVLSVITGGFAGAIIVFILRNKKALY